MSAGRRSIRQLYKICTRKFQIIVVSFSRQGRAFKLYHFQLPLVFIFNLLPDKSTVSLVILKFPASPTGPHYCLLSHPRFVRNLILSFSFAPTYPHAVSCKYTSPPGI